MRITLDNGCIKVAADTYGGELQSLRGMMLELNICGRAILPHTGERQLIFSRMWPDLPVESISWMERYMRCSPMGS